MIPKYDQEAVEDWDTPEDTLSAWVPDERIGAPVPNETRTRLARLAVAGTVAMAVYAVADMQPHWYRALAGRAHTLADALAVKGREAGAGMASAALPAVAEAPSTATPAETAASPEEHVPQGALELPARSVEETPPVTATAYTQEAEPVAEAPLQQAARARAVKAGLGPDLPNVLLTRLSKADIENATYAIETALKKTPGSATLRWPPKPSALEALFEVRFVAGAAEGCRRYVVTVTKEHWSTTSGAVEKCGRDESP